MGAEPPAYSSGPGGGGSSGATGVCEIKAAGPYKFIVFGGIDVTKPYKYVWFGDINARKPYEFLGSGGFYFANTGAFGPRFC